MPDAAPFVMRALFMNPCFLDCSLKEVLTNGGFKRMIDSSFFKDRKGAIRASFGDASAAFTGRPGGDRRADAVYLEDRKTEMSYRASKGDRHGQERSTIQ